MARSSPARLIQPMSPCPTPASTSSSTRRPSATTPSWKAPPAWIDRTLAQLGVGPATCLTDSYGSLFLDWKQRTGSPAENLTFDEIPTPAVLQPALG